MAEHPRDLSRRELDELLDRMVERGQEDTPEFARAFKEWERRDA